MTSFLRRLSILEYLRSSRQPKSTEDILSHLINSGYLDEEQKTSAQMRLVQRDMKFLYGDDPGDRSERNSDDVDNRYIQNNQDGADDEGEEENTNELGLICKRGPGKSWLWSLDPYNQRRFDYEKMPHYMAMAFAMTKKHLSTLLPRNTLTELDIFFSRANDKLQKTANQLSNPSYIRLKEAVAFYQRGQRLQAADYDIEHLDSVYRAILRQKQITLMYRNKAYQLHPLGVAILLPKIYLVALKDEDIHSGISFDNASYRHFLLHKIDSIQIEEKAAIILDGFTLQNYLEQGYMDVLIDPDDNQQYSVSIMIRPKYNASNLLTDLSENPLHKNQSIIQEGENEYLMRASLRRTIQLRNWIINLGEECEVLEPAILRHDVADYMSKALSRYQG